jgi:hypothetical protein
MAVQGVEMDIIRALVNMIKAQLRLKEFSTGSKGFHATGKITVEGIRYQAQAQAVLVGSKDDPGATVEATTEEIIIALEDLLMAHPPGPKTFSSGRAGYHATRRVEAHGQRFQVNIQAVRLD